MVAKQLDTTYERALTNNSNDNNCNSNNNNYTDKKTVLKSRFWSQKSKMLGLKNASRMYTILN